PPHITFSLGVVDGRNIWKTDLSRTIRLVEHAVQTLASERILVAPSCSLLHVPVDLDLETELGEVKEWLAFARQKPDEIGTICKAVDEGETSVDAILSANRASMQRRQPA